MGAGGSVEALPSSKEDALAKGFTEEQMRACVLDGGTRFVAPGQVTYWRDDGDINYVSAERKELTDEDVRRALPMLGGAVDIDLAGCALLTDAIITEIGSCCSSLETLNLAYVELAARDVAVRDIVTMTYK